MNCLPNGSFSSVLEVAVTGTVTSVGFVGFGVGLWDGVGVGLGVVVVVVDGKGGYAKRNININLKIGQILVLNP